MSYEHCTLHHGRQEHMLVGVSQKYPITWLCLLSIPDRQSLDLSCHPRGKPQRLDLEPFKILILLATPLWLSFEEQNWHTWEHWATSNSSLCPLCGGQELGMMPGGNKAKGSWVSWGGALGGRVSQSRGPGSWKQGGESCRVILHLVFWYQKFQ